jgi:hypothetical protein
MGKRPSNSPYGDVSGTGGGTIVLLVCIALAVLCGFGAYWLGVH